MLNFVLDKTSGVPVRMACTFVREKAEGKKVKQVLRNVQITKGFNVCHAGYVWDNKILPIIKAPEKKMGLLGEGGGEGSLEKLCTPLEKFRLHS